MATEETLYTGTVTDIAALIQACDFPPDAYVLVERQPRTVVEEGGRQDLLRFDRLNEVIADKKFDFASYTSGRVFHPRFELRWEQNAVKMGEASVVYIGVERKLPEVLKPRATLRSDGKEHHYYLFGELLDQDKQSKMGLEHSQGYEYYAETRIPRLLRYPEPAQGRQPQRLQLLAREYHLIDEEGEKSEESEGQGRIYRFLNLVEAQEGKS